MGITRWSNRYQSRRDPQSELRIRLREFASSRVRYGYRRLTVLLRREGRKVNAERIYWLYREEGLQVRTAKHGKRAAHTRVPLPQATRPNQRWSMDFVSDRFADGRWFRILTVVDQYTKESLCTHAERSQSGEKVVEQLKRLMTLRGAPESITIDNGSEFASRAMETWAYQAGVKLDFIRPGRPVQNAFIEPEPSSQRTGRSNTRRIRQHPGMPALNSEVFFDVSDAREKIERWRRDYNCNRPHSSLGDRTPEEFASILGCRPFALPIVGKAAPAPSQGFADAGRKAPALDRAPELPCKTEIRAKGLPERPRSRVSLLERVN